MYTTHIFFLNNKIIIIPISVCCCPPHHRPTPNHLDLRARLQPEHDHLVPGSRILIHRTGHERANCPSITFRGTAHQPHHRRGLSGVGGERGRRRAECVGGRDSGHTRSAQGPSGSDPDRHLPWDRKQYVLWNACPKSVAIASRSVSQHGEEQGTHAVALPGRWESAAEAERLLRTRAEV